MDDVSPYILLYPYYGLISAKHDIDDTIALISSNAFCVGSRKLFLHFLFIFGV